ncbi:hypothetical protein ACJIZ3_000991 [Penstemon smallii]|uniref:BHLH domain-containing protein n=1 Tax=Penstemon smallii TaxID=265156 RepID=A0ABD3U5W6_9LAMI
MPLSEFLRMARGKLESAQQKPCPTDISTRDEDVVELVWENGQIMMQGQSSRVTRSPNRHGLPFNAPRVRDSATNTRTGKFGGVNSILDDISPVVPSRELELSQDDDMAPWLNYPLDDALPNYCNEFLPEISGVTSNGMSTQNSLVSGGKRSNFDQSLKVSSSKAHPLCSWPPQQGSGVSDINSNNISITIGPPNNNNNLNLFNFSHFSRPSTNVKANLPSGDGICTQISSGLEKMEVKEKGSTSSGSNPIKASFNDQLNTNQKHTDFHFTTAVAKAPNESFPAENLIKNNEPLIPSESKRAPDGEGTVEPMVASSSVGSGNSADRISCEQTHNSKRKFRDVDESEYRSDDIETESGGGKKPTCARGGTGSKRSRAAEVHNLSERRRRDRINEKMRALQELIPNCNKADKASMLDEAIEYLKTLQLQVQIMSMGAGLCMPPQMMFPTGMHPAHMPHFSAMGMGMGMGMGYGMGMVDMNGASHGCSILPVPPMQGPHFFSPMSGPGNFSRMPGSNIPVYGHPGQGLSNPLARAPLVPSTARPPLNLATGLSASRVGSHNELPGTSQTLTNKNMQNAEASSNQVQATNEVTAVQENKQATYVRGTDISKEAGCD